MSKLSLVLLVLASMTIYDPQRAINIVGPQAEMIIYKLKAAFDADRFLPGIRRFGRG